METRETERRPLYHSPTAVTGCMSAADRVVRSFIRMTDADVGALMIMRPSCAQHILSYLRIKWLHVRGQTHFIRGRDHASAHTAPLTIRQDKKSVKTVESRL